MENIEQIPVGQVVANNYRTAAVFKKFGIDFCCNGNKTIAQACEQSNVDPEEVVKDIKQVLTVPPADHTDSANFSSWPLDLLADYIEKKHHRYVTEQIPVLESYLEKLVNVHGKNHPELREIRKWFHESAADLTVHMKKEELILFPIIRKMVNAKTTNQEQNSSSFRSIRNPIQKMMQEHEIEGERFQMIHFLSGNYTVPADGFTTYRLTYDLLKAFEEDLHLHIHLENNILFPKAVEWEKKNIHMMNKIV
jgi:regulator of cell morphogenesis and NO signaling